MKSFSAVAKFIHPAYSLFRFDCKQTFLLKPAIMSFSALLVFLALLIVVGVLWYRLDRLSLVVQALEKKVAALKADPGVSVPLAHVPVSQAFHKTHVVQDEPLGFPLPPIEKKDGVASSPVSRGFSLLTLMRQNLFATAGIASMLLGFALLFDTISWGDLISPALRILLAWGAAGGLAYAGARFGRQNPLWGSISQGGAAAIAYLATYVGHADYAILPQGVALGLYVGLAVALVARSMKIDSQILAGVGFVGAYVAPALAFHANASQSINLLFGLTATIFALWVSLQKRWRDLAFHAHLFAVALAVWSLKEGIALSAFEQQAFLNAYLAIFVLWFVGWIKSFEDAHKDLHVMVPVLSFVVLVYLGLQHVLLENLAWIMVTGTTACALFALATKAMPDAFKTPLSVLSLFAMSTVGLGEGDASHFPSLALFVQGSVMLLSSYIDGQRDRAKGISRFIALACLLAAFITLSGESAYLQFVLTAVFFALAVTGVAPIVRAERQIFAVLATLSLALLPAEVEGFPRPLLGAAWLFGAGALCALAFRMKEGWAARMTMGVLMMVGLAALIFATPEGFAVAQLAAIVLAILTAKILIHRAAISPLSRQELLSGMSTILALQLPALVALKFDGAPFLIMALSSIGAGLCWQIRPYPAHLRWPAVAWAGITAALALFVMGGSVWWASLLFPVAVALTGLAAHDAQDRQPVVFWLGGRALMSSASVFVLYAWGWYFFEALSLEMSSGATGAGMPWKALLSSPILPVVLSAAGVYWLLRSVREQNRPDWIVAAGLCVGAMVTALAQIDGSLFSPLGGALSLLAIGLLFLVAGYWAPLPPARATHKGTSHAAS